MTRRLGTDFCEREGLPEDACILIPVEDIDDVPMRAPEGTSTLLVVAVGTPIGATTLNEATGAIGTTGGPGSNGTDKVVDVALFAGCWLPDQPQPNHHDGDVVIRLTPPTWRDGDRVDVQMLQLYNNRWQTVGTWYDVGTDWPHIVAPTAAAVMDLHTDLCQAATPVTWVEPRADLL